jgi:hypothetical protein
MNKTVLAISVLVSMLPAASTRAQTADEIIARSVEARGGLAALQARQTVKMTARVERPQEGFGYSMTLYRRRPSFYKSVLETGDTTVIRSTDGEVTWVVNTSAGINEPTEVPSDQMAAFIRQANLDTSLQGLLPERSTATFLGRVTDEDGEFFSVKIRHRDGAEVTNYYDVDTYLVKKAFSVQRSPEGEQQVVVLLSEYKEVDGVVYSFRSERMVEGVTVATTTWLAFEHDVPMDDSMFRMLG